MNEKVRSRVQAAEMGFLRRISCLTLLDKVKSADMRGSLNIELLLLRLEKSQLRWYGHVTRMSQERTAKKLLCSTEQNRVLFVAQCSYITSTSIQITDAILKKKWSNRLLRRDHRSSSQAAALLLQLLNSPHKYQKT